MFSNDKFIRDLTKVIRKVVWEETGKMYPLKLDDLIKSVGAETLYPKFEYEPEQVYAINMHIDLPVFLGIDEFEYSMSSDIYNNLLILINGFAGQMVRFQAYKDNIQYDHIGYAVEGYDDFDCPYEALNYLSQHKEILYYYGLHLHNLGEAFRTFIKILQFQQKQLIALRERENLAALEPVEEKPLEQRIRERYCHSNPEQDEEFFRMQARRLERNRERN